MPTKKPAKRSKPTKAARTANKPILRRNPEPEPEEQTPLGGRHFLIVGIGASAGGLDALERFFKHMPPAAGVAIVVVVHLDPKHASVLAELIQRYTAMAVHQIGNGMPVKPNSVYIIPPNADLALLHGRLHLIEPPLAPGLRLPIDYFFRSLAQDQRDRAIGIVLSGMGTDGTLGLKAIKAEFGIAMAQEPDTAQCDGMPVSAINAGVVDYVLPPEQMPEQILQFARRAGVEPSPDEAPAASELSKVLLLLRSHTGHDFSDYKPNTIWRRVRRRMSVHQIDHLNRYARFLQDNPQELDLLFQDLLIGVTSFFRDARAFEALARKVLPPLLADKPRDYCVRAWVPGCSTGEEAYSIAMLFREAMARQRRQYGLQVFGTDIDKRAIEIARAGVYPGSAVRDVGPERLRRFFVTGPDGCRIRKEIRESVVFATQDILRDPPFTKLDLISCRNLLIYLNPNLQKKVVPLFHYALRPGGVLFLGSSETVGEYADLYTLLDRKSKIYKRKDTPMMAAALDFPITVAARKADAVPGRAPAQDLSQLAAAFLLKNYVPPAVIVNSRGDILHIHGRTGAYLEPHPGKARMNILEMAREGLGTALASALRRAVARGQKVVERGVRVVTNGGTEEIDLTMVPLPGEGGLVAVIFPPVAASGKHRQIASKAVADRRPPGRSAELERELAQLKAGHQTAVEELETSNEELRSANEELQSTNEELQSTNEELETSKEEMQSLHEEVTTVNSELQGKLDQLAGANNDLKNLLESTGTPILFLDSNLRVRGVTQDSALVSHLVQADVGRPITDFASKLRYDGLAQDAQRVLRDLVRVEREVETTDGRWYLMRIAPYRTLENVIDGVVVTFLDIHEMRTARDEVDRLNQELVAARNYAERIVDTVREPLLVLDEDLRVISANQTFYTFFQTSRSETVGSSVFELGAGEWDVPALRGLLASTAQDDKPLLCELEQEFPQIGARKLLLDARPMVRRAGGSRLILLAIQDASGAQSRKAGGVEE